MKNTAMTLLAGFALVATAQAGEDYSAKGKEVIPPPPAPCLWTWFAGGSVGQFTGDWDGEIYTLHVGAEYKCPTSKCSHAIFLEVGYTEDDGRLITNDQGIGYYDRYDYEASIMPITLNYKFECALTNSLNWYVGAGAGVALVDVDIDYTSYIRGTAVTSSSFSRDDTVFYAHIFAGLTYNINERFEIFGGARYVFMDDVNLGSGDIESPIDGEIHYELGARFNF